MKLIVGLGNPGDKYSKTRHNIGFLVLDQLLEDKQRLDKTFWEEDKKYKALIKSITIKDQDVLLMKPQTFMNNSGLSINAFASYYKIPSTDIFVIHDDLDLPLGKVRIRMGGAAGGHRGVESIIQHLSTDLFLRIRLGIGRPQRHEGSQRDKSTLAVDDYVLAPFTPQEKSKVRTMIHEVERSLEVLLKEGIDTYMSKYNKK